MTRPRESRADKRVSLASGMLTAVLALLGARQMAFEAPGAGGPRPQLAVASVTPEPTPRP